MMASSWRQMMLVMVWIALLNEIAARNTSDIPVVGKDLINLGFTKCCRGSYSVLTDSCDDDVNQVFSEFRSPSVYSHQDNGTVASDEIDFFQSDYNLTDCPDGYITQVAMDFRFYDDGRLTTASDNYPSDRFCLDRVTERSGEGDPQFLARFCVLDPCRNRVCIRKCCPHGMSVHTDHRTCQFDASAFAAVLHAPVDAFILNGAKMPDCSFGINLLSPDLDSEDTFYVTASGDLFVASYSPNYSVNTTSYCMDTFLDGNITAIRALTCFPEEESENVVFSTYPYFMFVSAGCLILTFVIYAVIPELRNVHAVTVMCYVISLAVMFISLGTIQLATRSINDLLCISLAQIAHFSFLSTFTWLNVTSFDTWWSFRHPTSSEPGPQWNRNSKRRCLMYSLYAWGVPSCIVIMGEILDLFTDLGPKFGQVSCWFSDNTALAVNLYIPIGVLITGNIVFFILTIILLCGNRSRNVADNRNNTKRKFYIVLSLSIWMGVSWIMELISFAVGGPEVLWIATDILNISTGIFTFVIFVCNRKVLTLIARKCCGKKSPGRASGYEMSTFITNENQQTTIDT